MTRSTHATTGPPNSRSIAAFTPKSSRAPPLLQPALVADVIPAPRRDEQVGTDCHRPPHLCTALALLLAPGRHSCASHASATVSLPSSGRSRRCARSPRRIFSPTIGLDKCYKHRLVTAHPCLSLLTSAATHPPRLAPTVPRVVGSTVPLRTRVIRTKPLAQVHLSASTDDSMPSHLAPAFWLAAAAVSAWCPTPVDMASHF
jgi:hypothetical protein